MEYSTDVLSNNESQYTRELAMYGLETLSKIRSLSVYIQGLRGVSIPFDILKLNCLTPNS